MNCPNCSNRLIKETAGTLELNFCPRCKGKWFDAGEFGDFISMLCKNEQVEPAKFKLFRRIEVDNLKGFFEKPRSCPKCKRQLKKFNYAYDSNVILDKCPDCKGIWADEGESIKVASYIKNDPKFEAIIKLIIESGRDLSSELEEEIAKDVVKGIFFLPRMIVPFADDVQRQRWPVMTVFLITVSVLIYFSQMLFNSDWILETVDLIPKNLKEAYYFDTLGTIFSQGGLPHLVWNMLFLWLFGDNLEDRFSRVGYLMLFIFCGAMSLGMYSLLNNNLPASAIGIGGAVSGVMGAFVIFYPTANLKFFVAGGVREVPAVLCLTTWFVFQLLFPFIFKSQASLTAICFSHVSGFILGIIIGSYKKIKAGNNNS